MSIFGLALLALSSPTLPALPQDGSTLSYSYFEVAAGQGDFDGTDSDDVVLGGSYAVSDALFVFASHTNYSMDVAPASLDFSILRVGLGIHTELSPNVDVYGSAAYADMEVDLTIPGLGSATGSEDGQAFAAGLRASASDQLELYAGVELIEIDNADDTIYSAGATFNLTEKVGVGLSYTSADDYDSTMIGLRVYL